MKNREKKQKKIQEQFCPDNQMHLVDKVFGDGKKLIVFYYREQLDKYKQGFFAYVDSEEWKEDKSSVMDEVQNYLIATVGVIDEGDFAELKEYQCCKDTTNDYSCEEHREEFEEWLANEFPKIDLTYGGVCHYDSLS